MHHPPGTDIHPVRIAASIREAPAAVNPYAPQAARLPLASQRDTPVSVHTGLEQISALAHNHQQSLAVLYRSRLVPALLVARPPGSEQFVNMEEPCPLEYARRPSMTENG